MVREHPNNRFSSVRFHQRRLPDLRGLQSTVDHTRTGAGLVIRNQSNKRFQCSNLDDEIPEFVPSWCESDECLKA